MRNLIGAFMILVLGKSGLKEIPNVESMGVRVNY